MKLIWKETKVLIKEITTKFDKNEELENNQNFFFNILSEYFFINSPEYFNFRKNFNFNHL